MNSLRKTPLYDEHLKLGAKIVDFAGWLMPVHYSNVIDEHITTRTKAGLFDICHMGELLIEGSDAKKLLNRLITKDLEKLKPNKAFYACMCYESGTVVDDLFVYCFNGERYMLVVNASNIDKDFGWIARHSAGFDVKLTNKSDEVAKLDLQGPLAERILQKLTTADLPGLKRFSFVECVVDGVKSIISRTGYTAEDGFEIYFDAGEAVKIWNSLLSAGKEFGLKPVGLGARDTLRIEACYSLYGNELSNEITPLEAAIRFVVGFDKEDFIGKDVLVRQRDNLKRKITAFEMIDKAVPREHYEILKNGEGIGFVTSGTFSPTFKKGICLGMIDTAYRMIGSEVEIRVREKNYKAVIAKRPLYQFHYKNQQNKMRNKVIK